MSLLMVYGMETYNKALLAGGLVKSGFTMNIKKIRAAISMKFVLTMSNGGKNTGVKCDG